MNSPGDAILQAVLAEPEEDAHRLVYADWLTDHGRTLLDAARAELIRVQVAREAADEDGDDHWKLRARERWLLARWNKGLAGPLRRLVRRYRFRRGFVEWVETTDYQCRRDLTALAPIRGLRPLGMPWLHQPAFLERVVECDLGRTFLWDAPEYLAWLREMPRLQTLDLGGTPGFAAAVRCQAAMPDLVRRVLALPVPPGLRSLALSGALEASRQMPAFLQSPWLAQLEALTLRGTALELSPVLLQRLSKFPAAANLRHLCLDRGTLLGFNAPPGDCLRNLRSLELRHCGTFWGKTADWFVRLPLPELRRLSLVGCGLAEDAAARFFRNPAWPLLHTLEVRAVPGLHARTYEALADGPLLGRLRRLALPGIDGPSLRRLAHGLRPLTSGEEKAVGSGPRRLAELCVELGDGPRDILAALAAAPHLAGLTTLEVPGHGDLDLDALDPPALPHLSWLDVRGRRLPPETIARLRHRYGPGFRYGACPELGLPGTLATTGDEIPF